MKRIEATFQLVTPCFTGPDKDTAALRVASIKGVLRFWWRALHYTHDGALQNLRQEEEALFGSSEKGQSRILMHLKPGKKSPSVCQKAEVLSSNSKVVGPGARYLGYGVMESFASKSKGTKAGELTRPCLAAPCEFVLHIGARDRDEWALQAIDPALRLLGLIGGVGARSRKGYGSLNLIALKGDGIDNTWQPPQTADEYRDRLQHCLRSVPTKPKGDDPEPLISAFSSHTRIDLLYENGKDPLQLIDDYGRDMVRYRSWGRNGKILNDELSKKRFPEDHDWMKGEKTDQDFHPRRAVFGLPHNYGKGISVTTETYERRASPLFFHVHKIGKTYAGIALLLRARFLPEDEKIKVKNTRDVQCVPARPDWSVLTEFLKENRKRQMWPND